MGEVAELIGEALDAPGDDAALAAIRGEVLELCQALPALRQAVKCPFCGDLEDKVVDSRAVAGG